MSVWLVKQSLIDLVFPPTCLRCHRWTGRAVPPFCPSCDTALELERAREACPRCGVSVAPFEVDDGQCGRCRRRASHIARTMRVAAYGGVAAELLRAYKYRRRDELEPILCEWLVEALERAPWFGEVDAIVAVPTHWTRRIVRPRYPASALAALVAKQTGVDNLPILRRIRAGPHQIGLNYLQRLSNVRGAFVLRSGIALKDARLLLIDDVMTTGATIEECARVLCRGGARRVFAAVVVRVSARPGAPLPQI